MNLSKIFAFNELMMRVGGTTENPLFIAVDVCRIFKIKNVSKALAEFSETEKSICLIDTADGQQEMLALTEVGLYRLIFRSDKPTARKFQDWVFGGVLPEIRKHGCYGADPVDQFWKALFMAKTGKVQLAILEAMGINCDI